MNSMRKHSSHMVSSTIPFQQSVLAPYDKYVFQEDNQLKDAENCLEEGKKKLQEGDLPSAVLLFEAAVQQNPDNSEAWALLGTSQVSTKKNILGLLISRTRPKPTQTQPDLDPNSILCQAKPDELTNITPKKPY